MSRLQYFTNIDPCKLHLYRIEKVDTKKFLMVNNFLKWTIPVVAYSGTVYCDGKRAHYDSAPAPTFFLHGDKDKIVNYKKFPPLLRSGLYGPTKLHRLFEKKGYPHWYFIYEGIGHEVSGLMNYTIQEFDAFVNKTLAGSRMQYDATLRDANVRPTKWTSMNVFELYKGK